MIDTDQVAEMLGITSTRTNMYREANLLIPVQHKRYRYLKSAIEKFSITREPQVKKYSKKEIITCEDIYKYMKDEYEKKGKAICTKDIIIEFTKRMNNEYIDYQVKVTYRVSNSLRILKSKNSIIQQGRGKYVPI